MICVQMMCGMWISLPETPTKIPLKNVTNIRDKKFENNIIYVFHYS